MKKHLSFEENMIMFFKNNWKSIAVILISILAISMRLLNFTFHSGDYNAYLAPWTNHLKHNGHFKALAVLGADYSMPYLYILSAISYLPNEWFLYTIKIISCLFDFVAAIYVYKIATKLTQNDDIGLVGYSMVLLWPTILINSSMWAQCDIIYTTFLLIMIWNFLNEKPSWALFFYGLAFSFKLQAIFFLPLLIILFIYQKWSIKDAVFAFISWVGINIPSWFMGVPVTHFITIYISQGKTYAFLLTLNAPTIFSFLPSGAEGASYLSTFGVLFTFAILVCLALYILKADKKLSYKTFLLLCLFCALVIPYFLPHMHERYFFLADLIVILYICFVPKHWWVAMLIVLPSCATYIKFLYGYDVANLKLLAILTGAAVVFVIKWLIESIQTDVPAKENIEALQEA